MLKRLFGIVGCMVGFWTGNAQITLSGNATAQQLAAKLAGPGVTVLNPVLTCPVRANGVFRAAAGNLGLDSGIVLTTGLANTEPGGNGVNGAAFNLASNRNNAAGDPDLDRLAGQATHDACMLEFDVIPQGDTVKFDYVFGSEEYINATCGPYNDAFAFFISGPGITGRQNMALVPGTSIPVTINSINSGIPGPGLTLANCTSMGPGAPFTAYFINNNAGTVLTYEGFTTVLQAYHAVTPCATYHLKMTIADGGNYLYDSGVFIRAGSLQANTLKIAAAGGDGSSTRPVVVKTCAPGRFRISRPQAKPTADTVRFIISGSAVNGYDYAYIPDSIVIPAGNVAADVLIQGLATPASGPRTVKLLVLSPLNCNGARFADSAALTLTDTFGIRITTPAPVLCAGEAVRLAAAGDTGLTYSWTPPLGLDSPGIARPLATPARSTVYTVQASWPQFGCAHKSDSVLVRVLPVPELHTSPVTDVCPHSDVQLAVQVDPPYSRYTYSWSGPEGFTAGSAMPTIRDIRKRNEGRYIVTVQLDTSRCIATDTLLLTVGGPDTPGVAPVILCQGKPAAPLTASGAQLRWYEQSSGGTGATIAPVPNTDQTGTQYFWVSQTVFDCESERSRLQVEVRVCCDHPVYMPTAFTPNGDGHNDTFSPRYSGFGYTTSRMRIFNRWGQMIFQTFNGAPWTGTWNNREAPSDSYFYELIVKCQEGGEQQLKGDVLLLR